MCADVYVYVCACTYLCMHTHTYAYIYSTCDFICTEVFSDKEIPSVNVDLQLYLAVYNLVELLGPLRDCDLTRITQYILQVGLEPRAY